MKTKIKEYISNEDYNTASDLIDEINRDIERKLEDAIGRAEKNSRKTVGARDY